MNIQQTIEYFQLLFLLFMARRIDRKYYILKIGCNLRFFFKSQSYPEDIDFDLQGISVRDFRDQINGILKSKSFMDALSIKGLAVGHITEHKQTETTQRLKLGIISEHMQIPTRIEFSRRDGKRGEIRFEAVDPIILKKYEITLVLVNHYTRETAFLQKIYAMSSRTIPRARDVFDLYLLVTTGTDIPTILKTGINLR